MGIELNTDGTFKKIVGNGDITILGGARTLLTYGFTNSVSIGAFSDLTLAIKTSISAAISMTASMGPTYAFSFKDDGLMGNSGGFHHRTSYVGNVGTDFEKKVSIEALRMTAKTMILLQTAAMATMAGATIAAIATQSPDKEKGEVFTFPGTETPMGYATSLMTLYASLTPALLLIIQKAERLDKQNQPNSILSMNAETATFLGARSANGSGAAGLRLDESGMEMSTAKGLKFDKPSGSKTVTRFNKKAEDAGGARLRLNTGGEIQSWGQSSTSTIKDLAYQRAGAHELAVFKNGEHTDSLLHIAEKGSFIVAGDESSLLVHKDPKVNARAKKSFLNLNSTSATLGQTGSQVACESSKIEIKASGQKITIDGSGIKLGNEITILSPGAPEGQAPALNEIQDAEKQEQKDIQADESAQDAQDAKLEAAQDALKLSKNALISLQAQLNALNKKSD